MLRSDLSTRSRQFTSVPCSLLGDFNAVRSIFEAIGGRPGLTGNIQDFTNFIVQTELDDLRTIGCPLNWSNKREWE